MGVQYEQKTSFFYLSSNRIDHATANYYNLSINTSHIYKLGNRFYISWTNVVW